ncbi:MAG: glycosyltransferase family 4 protein [Cyanobacteria bacterium NC_groundwater_1444_Ag_S-0.65um_54_12]|nr:glycosyltransferase family 4 protein [Cyanobacteria bacterium NC_groundwater_1444_Ag_S-0.65um_54_12]
MRILFLTPYYPPEVGAPQTRICELAVRLARRGHQVQVLTALPNYPSGSIPLEYRDRDASWEECEGVEVYRTWIYATPNRGFLRRVLNHFSFMLTALIAAPRMEPCDVVVAESPPLFDGMAGWAIAHCRRARFFFNVADLWPQSAVELGAIAKGSLPERIAAWIEHWCYQRADRILAVTRGIESQLRTAGWAQAVYFPNGVEVSRFAGADGRSFRIAQGLTDGFLVLYAGTHGLSQALDTVLLAARNLATDPRIRFILVGDGAEKDRLVAMNVTNVRFLASQPRERMPEILAAADAILVPLRDLPLFHGAVPSKTYEALAAARPVIMAVKGEAAALIRQAQAGLVVPPEDPLALAGAIRELASDPELCRRLGECGRRFVKENFDRERLADRFEELLKASKIK